MALGHDAYVAICYGVGIPLLFLFAAYAVAYGNWFQRRHMRITDTEGFTTARGTQSLWRIGWSFFCGAVGVWALCTPANFAGIAGIVGVCAYAVSTGLPILLIAFAGERITGGMPHVFSLSDFVGWRFGPIAKTVAVLIALFNMCIVLLAEYTVIGQVFQNFVGTWSWPIIVVVATLTMAYTAYGGLVVSIATDQIQGISSIALLAIVAGYVGVNYKRPIPAVLPDNLGPNEVGWTSIFTLGASLIASTMFSEAMWQRVWASESRATLRGGAVIGFVLTTALVFTTGFGGWLALLGKKVRPGSNPDLNFFALMGRGYVKNWVGVVVVLLALCMNEGAVDSLQNGIAAALGGHFFKRSPLWANRVGVVALNIPLCILAITRGYNALSLFLVTNLLCCCAAPPIALGLIRRTNRFFTETGVLVGLVSAVLSLTALGIGIKWDPKNVAGSFASGADWAWYSNNYDWRAFLVALLVSAGANVLWCAGAWALRTKFGVHGPGIAGIMMRIPGMEAVTASHGWTREGQPRGWDDAPVEAIPTGKDAGAGAA